MFLASSFVSEECRDFVPLDFTKDKPSADWPLSIDARISVSHEHKNEALKNVFPSVDCRRMSHASDIGLQQTPLAPSCIPFARLIQVPSLL